MKSKGMIAAAILSAALAAPTYACTSVDEIFDDAGILFSQAKLNKNIASGSYEFAQYNAHFGSTFTDSWKFSVADNVTASVSVYDIQVGLDIPGLNLGHNAGSSTKYFNSAQIFDTQNLTFSVYDSKHNLLGTAHEDETLSNLSLLSGQTYTLKVSGVVGGIFGSAYHGVLETQVAPVPLGDTAPLLGSAIALLTLKLRKRKAV